MLSVTAQDTHNMWEEELKSRSKLGVRLSELDREKVEVMEQVRPVYIRTLNSGYLGLALLVDFSLFKLRI